MVGSGRWARLYAKGKRRPRFGAGTQLRRTASRAAQRASERLSGTAMLKSPSVEGRNMTKAMRQGNSRMAAALAPHSIPDANG